MQDHSHYGVGIDVGTTTVRCVIGYQTESSDAPNIVGVGAVPNSGMRRGVVVNIVSTAEAIDKALEEAERMSGHQVHSAVVSINGVHITAMSSKGVVAVGSQSHDISTDDLIRAEEAATIVQLPANREILQVTPRSYQLDGQENIRDPLGMSGVRLELDAHVITALSPHLKNLVKAVEMTETKARRLVVSGLAAARAVLSVAQMENGVALVDIGGSTTNIAVYEEGDLQHVAVIPIGSMNLTNDLAIGLRTDLDLAEKITLQHVSALRHSSKDQPKTIDLQHNHEKFSFDVQEIDMIVEARLEEIFELIDKELKQIGRSGKLPGGVVLTGGGASLTNIREYAKQQLRLPVRIANLSGFSGISDKVAKPEFAVALGLMMIDLDQNTQTSLRDAHQNGQNSGNKLLSNFLHQTSSVLKKFKP
ncbi:MAG TPA: cell division protein FtsA [Patescibacteria group bacterium]|jgi:cell division protein FtsA|nr:cell division protein FtsA [Patescibacteria group bacterium]